MMLTSQVCRNLVAREISTLYNFVNVESIKISFIRLDSSCISGLSDWIAAIVVESFLHYTDVQISPFVSI